MHCIRVLVAGPSVQDGRSTSGVPAKVLRTVTCWRTVYIIYIYNIGSNIQEKEKEKEKESVQDGDEGEKDLRKM